MARTHTHLRRFAVLVAIASSSLLGCGEADPPARSEREQEREQDREQEPAAHSESDLATDDSPADTTPGPSIRVLPVDEAARDPEFLAFRADPSRAVAGRDTAAPLAATDSTIKLSFGGDGGIERLREWLASPDRHLWAELGPGSRRAIPGR